MTAPIDIIRGMPREERLAFLRSLPPGALAADAKKHRFNARPLQGLPAYEDLARIELAIGGFGAGKTWWAVQLFLSLYLAGHLPTSALVGATFGDAVTTLILSETGIWAWLPYEWQAKAGHDVENTITRSKDGGIFQLPGLAPVQILSVEKPGRATGQGKYFSLYDDPAKCVKVCGERRARDMLKELRVSTREGRRPCVCIPTTLDGLGFMRRALSGNMKGVRKRNLGSARDNTHLAPVYVAETIGDLMTDGDAADIDGIERSHAAGALWRREWIDAHRVAHAPELRRVVVSVDPADDDKTTSDETGIVVVGEGHDGRLYVLADLTAKHPSHIWPAVCAWAFRTFQADAIVAETNRAAGLVRRCLAIEAPHVPLVEVQATRGKATRAEPLALQYRDGLVSHVDGGPQISRPGHEWIKVSVYDPASGRREEVEVEVRRDPDRWQTLEDELCSWVPRESRSPNGLDALVWACWYLRPPDGATGDGSEPAATGAPSRYNREFARRRAR